MPEASKAQTETFLLDRDGLDRLVRLLHGQGFTVIAPTRREEAIDFAPIQSGDDLPWGWTTHQEAGQYRLAPHDRPLAFHFANGPASLKRYLHPPERRLWRAGKTRTGFAVETEPPAAERYAFLGVRSCDLAALDLLDRIFLDGPYADPHYAAIREHALIIAVNCTTTAPTCFCASLETGPRATKGYDLVLTESADEEHDRILVETGSERGAALMRILTAQHAGPGHLAQARALSAKVAASQTRALGTSGLKERLQDHPDDPCWDAVADRCLTCGNCTMVCPTCFCTTVEDRTDVDGSHAERWQHWESCFTLDFSYLAGGSVRQSARSRYRQWLTHKLSTWVDQFGDIGCVGCGRCITWCPVGIDITAEAFKPGLAAQARRSTP